MCAGLCLFHSDEAKKNVLHTKPSRKNCFVDRFNVIFGFLFNLIANLSIISKNERVMQFSATAQSLFNNYQVNLD